MEPGMVVYVCNPSIWKGEAGRLWVWGQCGLHNETLSQKKSKQKEQNKVTIEVQKKWSLYLGKNWVCVSIRKKSSQVLVVHAYNPSYLWGWDQEDPTSRPAWRNSSWDPISKQPEQNGQEVCLKWGSEALSTTHTQFSDTQWVGNIWLVLSKWWTVSG
jgi:hypothetical protein